eukprot:8411928-Pyramimonas_sp.AAC.2
MSVVIPLPISHSKSPAPRHPAGDNGRHWETRQSGGAAPSGEPAGVTPRGSRCAIFARPHRKP